MTREVIENKLTNYFGYYELVDRQIYEKYGADSWQFFDTSILHTLLILRENIDRPFTVNDWYWGGIYDDRGLRTNVSDITKGKTDDGELYISGHVFGKAIDFKVKGMTADAVRNWIQNNENLFPYKVRLEHTQLSTGKTITWVHIDTKWVKSNPKIYLFDI